MIPENRLHSESQIHVLARFSVIFFLSYSDQGSQRYAFFMAEFAFGVQAPTEVTTGDSTYLRRPLLISGTVSLNLIINIQMDKRKSNLQLANMDPFHSRIF